MSVINNALNSENSYLLKNTKIEDDLDPTVHTSGSLILDPDRYLKNVMNEFVEQQDTILYKFFETSCVKMDGEKRLNLTISYLEKLNGTDNNGIPFTANKRTATIIAIPAGKGRWKTFIANISFYDPAKIIDQGCLDIGDTKPIVEKNAPDKPAYYYSFMLVSGSRQMGKGNYAEAYYSFKEAEQDPGNAENAKKKIEELYNYMRTSGALAVNEALGNKLTIKGVELQSAHRYEEAYQYYSYALERNAVSAELRTRKSAMDEKVSDEKKLAANFERKQYDNGIAEYTAAIGKDPENSDLYLGRAKCYVKLNRDADARADFATAIKWDERNVAVYFEQGRFYEAKNTAASWDSAHMCFVNYINKSMYQDDPALIPIYSEAALCKGMSLYKKNNFPRAIDSFRSAISRDDSNYRAFCYLGCCFCNNEAGAYTIGNYDTAISYFKKAIAINEKYAEAHYWMGYALSVHHPQNLYDRTAEAIQEMRTAIGYDPDNGEWNLQLGMLLQRKGAFEEAVKCYAVCISDDLNNNIGQQALRRRGQCEYELKNYNHSLNFYNNIKQKTNSDFKDIGYVYLKMNKPDSALKYFSMAELGKSDAEGMYGKAEAVYLSNSNPAEKQYLPLFKSAFENGVPHDLVDNDAVVKKLEDSDNEFKKMKRENGY